MVPVHAGANLPISEWSKLRLRAIFDYCKWDPQCGDQSVLGRFPLLLESDTAVDLGHLAECLTGEALAAEHEIFANAKLLRRLSIPKPIRECLERTQKEPCANHVRVMRFDFHFTTRGWQISEVNADVPGGYVEASGWNKLFAEQVEGYDAPGDPTAVYADAICKTVMCGGLVALAHATVYSEDRQVMAHLSRELESRGRNTCLLFSSCAKAEEPLAKRPAPTVTAPAAIPFFRNDRRLEPDFLSFDSGLASAPR